MPGQPAPIHANPATSRLSRPTRTEFGTNGTFRTVTIPPPHATPTSPTHLHPDPSNPHQRNFYPFLHPAPTQIDRPVTPAHQGDGIVVFYPAVIASPCEATPIQRGTNRGIASQQRAMTEYFAVKPRRVGRTRQRSTVEIQRHPPAPRRPPRTHPDPTPPTPPTAPRHPATTFAAAHPAAHPIQCVPQCA